MWLGSRILPIASGCSGLVEATARLMEDKLFLDNDTTPSNTFYRGEVNNYLGDPNRTLMDISYTAALFWNYLTEQLGSPLPEPARGVDVIQRFWSFADGNEPDSVRFLRDTIDSFSTGTSLESMFIDFAITNYTHDLDLSSISNSGKQKAPSSRSRSTPSSSQRGTILMIPLWTRRPHFSHGVH